MKELKAVKEAVKKAGEEAMKFYGDKLDPDTHYKSENSPVTKADLAAEEIILNELKEFDYGILSEETSKENDRQNKDKVWVIDPLDGTKDFLQQTGEFTIMVGLVEDGEPILGAVYRPSEDVLYFATKDGGAYKQIGDEDPVQIFVSSDFEPEKMTMLVSRNHLLPTEQRVAEKMTIGNLQPCGSAGLKISKIAEDSAEVYINSSDKTSEWDICAADIILSEADGRITNTKGKQISYNKENPTNKFGFIASNGEQHDKIVEIFNEEKQQ